MNIGVIGSGGREQAIYWKLSQEKNVNKVYLLSNISLCPNRINCNLDNFSEIYKCCLKYTIELLIVGSERYLEKGIVDYFEKKNIKIFGPPKESAMLETSKIFAKNFMKKHDIPTPEYKSFNGINNTKKYLDDLNNYNIVIKYDGIADGKGVFVCGTLQDAEQALNYIETNYGSSSSIILEARFVGEEISILFVCSTAGKLKYQLVSTAKDYKKSLDNDKGANTGGMGAVSPHPSWNINIEKEIFANIVNKTFKGMIKENILYNGFLYFGIILTENGPRLLEYNTRMGDPEAQAILPNMLDDLNIIILNSLSGNIKENRVRMKEQVCIDVSLVSKGYPNKYKIGELIYGTELLNKDTLVFYSNVKFDKNSKYTNGGRVMHLVSHAKNTYLAREKVYKECEKIYFKNIAYRRDIGVILKKIPKKIVIFLSGRGSNFKAIYESIRTGVLKGLYEIEGVFSSNPQAAGLQFALENNIPTYCIDSSNYAEQKFNKLILQYLQGLSFDLIILAGYNKLLSREIVRKYYKRIINIHPADTKLYQGLHGYNWAFKKKLQETMITIHWVDEGCDTGEIIEQKNINLVGLNSVQEVETYGLSIEHQFYSEVLRKIQG